MRIWVFTNEYANDFIGGLGIVATRVAKDLKELGNDVAVICKHNKRRVAIEKYNNILIFRFPVNSDYIVLPKIIFNPVQISNYFKKHGIKLPDLIHVHSLECYQLAAYYKRHYRIPVVYTCHSLVSPGGKSKIGSVSALHQRSLFATADVVTVPSPWLKNMIRKHYPRMNKKIVVIPNAVNAPTDGLADKIEVYNQKKQFIHADQLLFVGRLNPVKGIEELIRAISILKKRRPWIRLYVIGGGSKKYTQKLNAIVRKLGLKSNIRWLGKMQPERVQKMYSSFGAVVVPSRSESFGLVALEVMANGVPLIATRKGGLASFVNSRNATVIESVTPQSIANGIRKALHDSNIYSKLQNGILTAKKYDWKTTSEQYNKLFSSLKEKA